jgi:hypothetical protein
MSIGLFNYIQNNPALANQLTNREPMQDPYAQRLGVYDASQFGQANPLAMSNYDSPQNAQLAMLQPQQTQTGPRAEYLPMYNNQGVDQFGFNRSGANPTREAELQTQNQMRNQMQQGPYAAHAQQAFQRMQQPQPMGGKGNLQNAINLRQPQMPNVTRPTIERRAMEIDGGFAPQLGAQRRAMQSMPSQNLPSNMSPNVSNIIQQLLAERRTNQQAVSASPMAQQPRQMMPQQQQMPFNFPQRYNYFFGPNPFSGGGFGQQQMPYSATMPFYNQQQSMYGQMPQQSPFFGQRPGLFDLASRFEGFGRLY